METKSKETTFTASLSSSADPQTGASQSSSGGTQRDNELRSQDRGYDRDRGNDRDRGYDRDRDYDRDRGYSSRDRDDDRRYGRDDDDRYSSERRYREEGPRQVWQQAPVVIDLDDEYDRGGRRYSRGLRDPQLCERDFTRGAQRFANAIADGLDVYRQERDRSAARERDGAVRDFLSNAGEGLSETLRSSSRVPRDITRNSPVSTDRLNRQIRNFVRPFFRMYFR